MRQTFGPDNLVSAVLHLDESTPHIHATIIPIVTGTRRKVQEQQRRKEEGREPASEAPKKKYRKKNPAAPRLCCDDLLTDKKLERYHDTYAKAMQKYGLQRGVRGSEARRVTQSEYYKSVFLVREEVTKEVEALRTEHSYLVQNMEALTYKSQLATRQLTEAEREAKRKAEEIAEAERRLQEADATRKKEELKGALLDTGAKLLGGGKAKRLEKELADLRQEKEELHRQNARLREEQEARLKQMEQKYNAELEKIMAGYGKRLKQQEDEMGLIKYAIPVVTDLLGINGLLLSMGVERQSVLDLLRERQLLYSGELHHPETQHPYSAEKVLLQIIPHPNQPGRLVLAIDKISPADWFRKQDETRRQEETMTVPYQSSGLGR